MDLGITTLIRTLSGGLVELTGKSTSAAVLLVTAVETSARTLNHAAEMAEVAVVATKSEMEIEFEATLTAMKQEVADNSA